MSYITNTVCSRPLANIGRFYSKNSKSKLNNILLNMPKMQKHIPDAQKQRKKIKEKYSKYVPGKVSLQVLGTGAEGAPRSLYVFSDQSRYLFQCGEGTQRLAHEHKMKLAKLEHIFVTQPIWKNIGGLPGTALTIQDVGVPQITLHGPKGLDDIFKATRRFVVIKDLQIKMADCKADEPFEDSVMTVRYVPLFKSKSNEKSNDSIEEETTSSDGDNRNKSIQNSVEMKDEGTATETRRQRKRSASKNQAGEEEDTTDYYAHESKKRSHSRRSRSRRNNRSCSASGTRSKTETIPETIKQNLSKTKESAISMAFICRLQPRPGALSLEKCVKLGVPPGPILGRLKAGEDVTMQNGTVIKSSEVCEPDDPGPVFIVVDCPSEAYLDSLQENTEFKKHQASGTSDDDLAYLVVHFSPKSVMQHPKYQKWMDEFSPSTYHLFLNDANSCMGSVAVHRIQYKLNMLSPEIFPLLGDKGTPISDEPSLIPASKKFKGDDSLQKSPESSTPKIENLTVKSRPNSPTGSNIQASTFCNFHLRPKTGLNRSSELKLVPQEYITETTSLSGFTEELNDLKEKVKEARASMTIKPYPKVLFLGTGSCIPNKTRNTSGILIQISENLNIVADCGEGTYGQIIRFFGVEKANEILCNLKGIYVSHLHADHHIGLVGLLQGRRRALNALNITNKKPLLLLAPKQIGAWLNFYDKCFEDIYEEYDLVPNQELIPGVENDVKGRVCELLELSDIQTTYVKHCPNAFGVAFTHKMGYKITYSGDTMPTDNLVEIGKNSDLLIHEATMEDELAHEAVTKMHSTTSQAIEIGQKMQAKHILLTHFSQRYAKLPMFNDNFKENVGIAFDNMHICMDELPLVPLLYPALKIMFAEHYEELEHKAVKRQLKIEREREAIEERQKAQ